MSKQLYINNKRVLLSDNTYFPFTHTISDLETVNIIGLPTSKSISIPRCMQNDEIFGNVAEISRINIDNTDNKIGISFNQINKCEYQLFNNSELVSKGILIIKEITDKEYTIECYDEIIQKLEDLDGNNDTNEYFLSSCDIIIDSSNNKLSMLSNSTNVYNLLSNNYIKPIINIKDEELDSQIIRCTTKSGATLVVDNIDLPNKCSGLQLRTIKNYNVNYAIPINNMINSINDKYNDIIEVDSSLNTLFNEVNLLCNSPSNDETSQTYNITEYTTNFLDATIRATNNGTGDDICLNNGYKSFKIDVEFKWTTTSPTSMIGGNIYDGSGVWNETYYGGAATGTIFSKQWVKIYLSNNGNTSLPVYYEIDCIKGINSIFTFASGGWNTVTVTSTINVDLNFFPKFLSEASIGQPTYIHYEMQNYDPNNSTLKYYLLTNKTATFDYQKLKNTSTLTETSIELRTNDLFTGKNILPKVSIKNFLIQIAKFFNLDIVVNNNKLKIQKKNYYLTPDVLLINEIKNINISNITFNKIKMTTLLPESDLLKKYTTYNKKTYGEQIINTGYSIKNNVKNINLDVTVPFLLKDSNSFAYDRYGKYFNGGYCKSNHGVITGIKEDTLTFGYLNLINEKIYITDDSPFEGGMNTSTITDASEVKFVHYNIKLYDDLTLPNSSGSKFYFSTAADPTYGIKTLSYYYTLSPYKFNGTDVVKSLEMNKSTVSYANITDANYTSDTTLYYNYHKNMLSDKYNSNTHILNVSLYIDGILDIYKIYNYKNVYYIISKIIEYDPTQPGIYEIELMRVNDINNYINNIII